jgi:SM-20-related protein
MFKADKTVSLLADSLRTHGYAIIDNAFYDDVPYVLSDRLNTLAEVDAMHRAGIGRRDDLTQREDIRGDEIHWLTDAHTSEALWVRTMAQLRIELNRHLLLGLFSYESHFSHYPAGAFYKTHTDSFRGEANRVLSTVFYLNPDWKVGDGGELVIYSESGEELERVVPVFNRLVVFLSEEFPHEVLPTATDRYSIAGWFRVNTSSAERVDPPA